MFAKLIFSDEFLFDQILCAQSVEQLFDSADSANKIPKFSNVNSTVMAASCATELLIRVLVAFPLIQCAAIAQGSLEKRKHITLPLLGSGPQACFVHPRRVTNNYMANHGSFNLHLFAYISRVQHCINVELALYCCLA